MSFSDPEVLVIGRSCLDHLAVVDHFPKENRKMALRTHLTEGGGQGGTASCCIARLGGRVAYVGQLGDDATGRLCRERLEAFGVDTRYVKIVPGGRTPEALVLVCPQNNSRTIVYEKNSLPPIRLDDQLARLISRARVVLLDPETTYLADAVKVSGQVHPVVVYDCERLREGIARMMAVADYFVPSADFLSAAHPDRDRSSFMRALCALRRRVKGELIVTHGDRGAFFWQADDLWRVAPPAVEVVDTTGAGDNFHAALALAIARNEPLIRAVRLAVTVASLSCRGLGGRGGIPTLEEADLLADKLTLEAFSDPMVTE